MSTQPKDHRPRIISVSFPTALDGLSITAHEEILWPCHAFNISVPQKKKSALNVFEETVLKMTEIESGDTEKIASITCLEKELVAFIQNRLTQLGLLNERYELSEHGKEILNEWQNKSNEDLEYTVATLFVDLLLGKLLPYVSMKPLNYKQILKIDDDGIIYFLRDPTKETSRVRARQIRPSGSSFWKTIPEPADIIKAIKEFKKKYKRYALLNQGAVQYLPTVPMAEAISINKNPELVYLHCTAFFQEGNPNLLVTDGCGLGFSESFAKYLIKQKWQWVIHLEEQGCTEIIGSVQNNEETDDEISVSDTRYREIANLFRRAQDSILEAENKVDSSDKEMEFISKCRDTVVNLYKAIEWALRFVVSDNPVPYWEQMFSLQSYHENGEILRKIAIEIGFDVSDSVKSLLQVKPGKIRAVDYGDPEMQPLLALAIAAARNNSTHPLYHLAIEDSKCLSFINTLKSIRDPVSHGSSTDVKLSLEILRAYHDRTARLIKALIPNISISDIIDSTSSPKINQGKDINQIRLKARLELYKSLGLEFVRTASPSLREALISVTILSQRRDLNNDQLQNCVNLMASIMQISLFEIVKERSYSVKNSTDLMDAAIKRIIQFGFYPAPDAIPKQISTVNPQRLCHAVHGPSATLGAYLLAIFLIGTEGELIQLQELYPTFIDFIANLLRLRGHGNKYQANFSQEDIEPLKNNVFKAIKIISEVF